MKKTPPVIHPFMIASLFVLVCYREVQPFVKWEELIGLWALMLAATYLLFRLLKWPLGEPYKAALMTTLGIVAFFFYGDIDSRIKWLLEKSPWPGLARTRWVFPVVLLALGGAAWLLVRTRKNLLRFKIFLNLAFSLMVVVTILQNSLWPVKFVSRRDRAREVDAHGPFSVTNNRPDIYYIILDSYTSAEALKEFWNYDNAPFVQCLESNGFFVVPDARANYDLTPRCLASSLNMALLPPPSPDLSSFGRVNRACEIIDLAAVPRKLQEIGYQVVNRSLFDVAGLEQHYCIGTMDFSSLYDVLRRKSVWGYVESWRNKRRVKEVNLGLFRELPELAARCDPAQPRFIYVHILMPHPPFFFDSRGERPHVDLNLTGPPDLYLEQLIYVNRLVTNTVAGILKNSRTPPIIILQGDHGARSVEGPGHWRERTMILNAYHLPGGNREWIYPGITPVNTFRMIFNHYFGAHYPYVPDKSFVGPALEEMK